MNRPIHFEIPADNPERAIEFYSQTFGWQFSKWEGPQPYWLIKTGSDCPGIDGGMMNRMSPAQGVANTLAVADLDAMVEAVVAAGGTVAMPKIAVKGIGWMAYVTDTEGNVFGMMQNDPAAA